MIERELFLEATGGQVVHAGRVTRYVAFASDSREAEPGDLFVAVHGRHADGHDFALEAAANGAAGVVLEGHNTLMRDEAFIARLRAFDVAIIVVPDVRVALRDYAAKILRVWGPRVIVVTGSAGKTTTKEAIATILSHHASTFRSWRNYNDLLGVPLSLGRLEPHHEFAVIELGSDSPEELAELARICRPEIAVVVNDFAPSEEFSMIRTLAQMMTAEQTLIIDLRSLMMGYGISVHNRQDGPTLVVFDPRGEIGWNTESPQAASDHLRIALKLPPAAVSEVFDFRGLYGEHWTATIVAALTVTSHLGFDWHLDATYLETFEPLPGRMRLLAGVHKARILDDTHNGLPTATVRALATLTFLGKQRWHRPRIAILGDITIGDHPAPEVLLKHIGEAVHHAAKWLITRGDGGAQIAQAAIAAGMPPERVVITHTSADAVSAALGIIRAMPTPPVILIKGAPEMRMETVTEGLLSDPTQAPYVLDRQRSVFKRAIVGEPNRPTWMEIDLAAIGDNTRAITQIVGPSVAVMATMKADAYGHGALKVAHTVLRNGATWLGVATLSEGANLRAAGITAPILVYGYLAPWQARDAVKLDVRVTVYALDTVQALARAAVTLDRPVRVHVKIDSGMGRLGLRAEDLAEVVAFFRMLHATPQVIVEGIFTHLATADEFDQTYAHKQLGRFAAVLAALEAAGLRPPIVHAANSATLLALPEARFDLVRPGVALYGLHPSADVSLPPQFRAALSFKTQIAQVKTVPTGESISYGATYVTTAPERIATLPVGYADGFRRGPTNWGEVLIRGQRAPIRGRVCMDQTMVSVQHIPEARAGDEVVLIGVQGDDRITAEAVAERLGTSNYEVVAALLARVPRVGD